ncbi:FtsQ-type POTRA domain-containing protein [bacterium]|jgi:cell division septal protein FtsQ|nr:FtsQ-type POTRA domain-containing protein [bacterium]MBT4291664.1 FtsQ-type POTRA domain-containing protein [bacterium]
MYKFLKLNSRKKELVTKKTDQRSSVRQYFFRFFSVLFFLSIVVGGYLLLNSSLFAISKIETYNVYYADENDVKDILQSSLGSNIWKLDSDSISLRISVLPCVKSVRVGRRLPSTVKVVVEEWHPVLLMDTGSSTMALLDNGSFQKLIKPAQSLEIPLFINNLNKGSLPNNTDCALLNELLQATDAIEFDVKFPVDFIILGEDGLSVVLQGSHNKLVLGVEEFAQRLGRYLIVAQELADESIIDLRFEQQVYIREKS